MNARKILEFICDEVTRQGHNINDLEDGFPRVTGMIRAWTDAIYTEGPLTIASIKYWAKQIEPAKNALGFRTCELNFGVPSREVPQRMGRWIGLIDKMTPDEAYKEFELIHPFRDGNGRTGKIIHNFLSGTLGDPVLVQDFFGHGNP